MGKGGGYLLAAALAASGILGALLGAAPARAESCPGNPNALGTSRTIVVDPNEYKLIGKFQYKQTLPLADHEVVLTFDDGPLPPYSNEVLDTLISQCVKATFFIVGEMARAYPDVLRREYEAGYTIGTHSQSHPLRFEHLTGDKLSAQIDGGIASVSAVLGKPDAVAPFFRIPGLGRSEVIEQALVARGLAVFSIDTDADDWFRRISAAQVVERAMSRLEKLGGGVLLLHDIHPWTAQGLPELLRQLKEHGFHIVNIVPPTSPEAATASAAKPATVASAEHALPAPDAQQAAPGPQDLGVSLHERSLSGAETGLRPSADVRAAPWHEHLRHAHLHRHHPAWRHAHVGIEGRHSDLPGWSHSAGSMSPSGEY